MAIPEAPQTRGEMYLNAIATGDASGIPSTPHTREEMYLDYIAKNGGGGGGSGLPEVSASDNGDVLTVVSGEWAKAAPSGGALKVNVTVSGDTATLDKTWQEIYDAGIAYCLLDNGDTDRTVAYLFKSEVLGGNYYSKFAYVNQEGGGSIGFDEFLFTASSADGYPSMTMGG